MHTSKIAHRYAKSLLGLASERGQEDAVAADMLTIREAVAESRDLRTMLSSPVVKADKKLKVLNAIFGAHIGEVSSAFIRILTQHGREDVLDEVAHSYVELNKKRKGILTAEVTTATPLNDELRKAVTAIVKEMNPQGDVVINEVVDSEIIGGFVLKVEDRMVDASVQSKLRSLRQNLIDTSYEALI